MFFTFVGASIGSPIIDLVAAPLNVSVLPHVRLPQLVESLATGDDPRRIRERTASLERLCALLCNFINSFSVIRTRPIAARLVVVGGAECDIVEALIS